MGHAQVDSHLRTVFRIGIHGVRYACRLAVFNDGIGTGKIKRRPRRHGIFDTGRVHGRIAIVTLGIVAQVHVIYRAA